MKKRHIWLYRFLLLLLILSDMAMIFSFSSENETESAKTSGRVVETLAELFVPDYEELSETEQTALLKKMQYPVRKLAHMTEFGILSGLTYLLITSFSTPLWWGFGGVLFAFLYACTDEWHQSFSSGRVMAFSDVGFDTLGAFLACLLLFLVVTLYRGFRQTHEVNEYTLSGKRKIRLALLTDLHGNYPDWIFSTLKEKNTPDFICIAGDVTDYEHLNADDGCYDFLRRCAEIAPTVYSLGNHEEACYHHGNPKRKMKKMSLSDAVKQKIVQTGALLLDDEIREIGDICFCGLSTGLSGKTNVPNLSLLKEFEKREGMKILLCHHPEYYMPYVRPLNIDLTLCGHAHGGQWRWFNRGLYAPGQGIFPKYTSGVVDNRCVISRGLGNHTKIPRYKNPTELIYINMEEKEK